MTIMHTNIGSELSQIHLILSISKCLLAYHLQHLETLPTNQVELACLAQSSRITGILHFRISTTESQICVE